MLSFQLPELNQALSGEQQLVPSSAGRRGHPDPQLKEKTCLQRGQQSLAMQEAKLKSLRQGSTPQAHLLSCHKPLLSSFSPLGSITSCSRVTSTTLLATAAREGCWGGDKPIGAGKYCKHVWGCFPSHQVNTKHLRAF